MPQMSRQHACSHQSHPLPPGSVPLWYLFIYLFPFLCFRGAPPPKGPSFPLHSQPIPEALQATSNVSVFIYRAYDFNFSINKSEQGWGPVFYAVVCGLGFRLLCVGRCEGWTGGTPRASYILS